MNATKGPSFTQSLASASTAKINPATSFTAQLQAQQIAAAAEKAAQQASGGGYASSVGRTPQLGTPVQGSGYASPTDKPAMTSSSFGPGSASSGTKAPAPPPAMSPPPQSSYNPVQQDYGPVVSQTPAYEPPPYSGGSAAYVPMPEIPGGGSGGDSAYAPSPYDASSGWNPPPLTAASAAKAIVKVDDTPVKKSLWERFLAFLGLAKAPPSKPSFGEDSKFDETIGAIVNRARSGDQNAMAMICLVRDNAKLGDPLAQRSVKAFQRYIDSNPVMGAEVSGNQMVATTFGDDVCAAFGAELSQEMIPNGVIRNFLTKFGAEEQHQFANGFVNGKKIRPEHLSYQKPMVRLGKSFRLAREAQCGSDDAVLCWISGE